MSTELSHSASRVAAVIRGTGRCPASTEEIAQAAHLDVLATQFALVELEVSGVISMRFVPGHGRIIEMTSPTARPGIAA